MTNLTKYSVMTNAWAYARNAAKNHGGKAIDYIGECMKIAWKKYKEIRDAKGGHIAGIKPDFLHANYEKAAAEHIKEATYKVVKATEKALLVEIPKGVGKEVNREWFPKAVCV